VLRLVPVRLVDREPVVPVETLVAGLVPPPHFADACFASYVPDPDQPSQRQAVALLEEFATRLEPLPRRRFRRSTAPLGRPGVYLDGGFGVGKTHLLAALWHAAPTPRAYATFVELTQLVGALGFAEAVQALSGHRLLAIDEFELDDPGNTVLVSTLLQRLVDAGVHVAATSNTLPGTLGEGRFDTADFLREIQGLRAHFDAVRVDGEDYRHRGLPAAPPPLSREDLERAAQRPGRLVVLVDRIYDRDLPVLISGVPLEELFPPELLCGGFRKKYQRCLSRLTALVRQGADRGGPC